MEEKIKEKVREIQDKYCGESVETKLYWAMREVFTDLEDLQNVYDIAMKEINRLRKLAYGDSQNKPKGSQC